MFGHTQEDLPAVQCNAIAAQRHQDTTERVPECHEEDEPGLHGPAWGQWKTGPEAYICNFHCD